MARFTITKRHAKDGRAIAIIKAPEGAIRLMVWHDKATGRDFYKTEGVDLAGQARLLYSEPIAWALP